MDNQVFILLELLRARSFDDIPFEFEYDFIIDDETGQDVTLQDYVENVILIRVSHLSTQTEEDNLLGKELLEQGFEAYYRLLFDFTYVGKDCDFHLSPQILADIKECVENKLIYTAQLISLRDEAENIKAQIILTKNTIC